MRTLQLSAVSMLVLLVSCQQQHEHSIRVVPQEHETFTQSDCGRFIAQVSAIAEEHGLEEQVSVPDEHLGHSFKEYWNDAQPVSFALFCGRETLQVSVTALAGDPTGLTEQAAYEASVADLTRTLEQHYGPRVEHIRSSVAVRR